MHMIIGRYKIMKDSVPPIAFRFLDNEVTPIFNFCSSPFFKNLLFVVEP